jgi:tetratricopeptide (TPR) repeat protein
MRIALLCTVCAAALAQDFDSLQKSGVALYSKGDYAGARQSLEQAWELAQQTPPEDARREDLLKLLARVTSAAGDYAAAANYMDIAINWRETNFGRTDPKLANEWIDLATLCERQKDFTRARELLGRALSSHVKTYGAVSTEVADDFSRIALVSLDQKQPEQATPALETAIDIREKALGAENPSILSDLDRLSAIWITLREYEKAEAAFRRSLVIRERLLGPLHAGLIETVEGLAYAQFGLKKYDEAEAGYKRLLNLWVVVTGDPAHPMVALTLDKLSNFYRETKRWDEGTGAALKSIAVRELFLANREVVEATARQGHGSNEEAQRYLRSALAHLDESRPEHAEALEAIHKALAELDSTAKPPRE